MKAVECERGKVEQNQKLREWMKAARDTYNSGLRLIKDGKAKCDFFRVRSNFATLVFGIECLKSAHTGIQRSNASILKTRVLFLRLVRKKSVRCFFRRSR